MTKPGASFFERRLIAACIPVHAGGPGTLRDTGLRRSDTGPGFPALEPQATESSRRAAEAAGVARIVYLGGVIPPNPRSAHLRSRLETGELLRSGSVAVTEVRAGIVVGPGSTAF